MGTISKMAEKCHKCPDKVTCNQKRMEACAYIDEPKIVRKAAVSAREYVAEPIIRETMQINIGGTIVAVYKDDIEKEIDKALREPFMLNYGA